ncbi:MAG: hypothetical protein JRH16_10655 [Deltaproteobacteria bacterium]|nr:hypothetical protein [Deltaproteobacteria bacterium]MBW2360445.1 hypothetical protein [Deltaproteobacteria bacterium]
MRARSLGLGLALLLGCAVPDGFLRSTAPEPAESVPEPLLPAEVSVEVWSGFTQRPGAAGSGTPEHVEIVLDLTTSMQASPPGRPARFMGAREAASRLLAALPPDTPVGVRALGLSAGANCSDTTHVAQGTPGALGHNLRNHLRALRPRSEGSLAGALQTVFERPSGPLDRTRVVVFSDLGAECGGDLCAAGSALAAAGARLEFVLLADAAVPECFASFAPETPPRIANARPAPVSPNFRIESHDIHSSSRGPVIARGRTDGDRVRLAPSHVLIVVEMNPPALVGPIALEPNSHTRVRILDFPTLDPPVREWGWTTEPASGPIAEELLPSDSTPAPTPAATEPAWAVMPPGGRG